MHQSSASVVCSDIDCFDKNGVVGGGSFDGLIQDV